MSISGKTDPVVQPIVAADIAEADENEVEGEHR